MKKLLTMFALGSTMMFASCGNEDKIDKNIITLDQQTTTHVVNAPAPCVIEVPCNEPGLKGSYVDADEQHKYYNFCDSTVTITGYTGGNGGPVFSKRPITTLLGTEKTEMENAYKKYQAVLGLGK